MLRSGTRVLDVGAGAQPTLIPPDRPQGCVYVGLDSSVEELERASTGSYDETVVSPVELRIPELEGRFDLALSWLAMEHVERLDDALENVRAYLAPGGTLLAQLAGRWSPFSIANRMFPAWLSRRLLARAQAREPESIFPASYDRCRYSELVGALERWEGAEVFPLYTGAGYVLFSRVLTGAYIAYEEILYRRDLREAAPYYLLMATR